MRKEKKYHYIYKTTNLKNGKFYIGIHSTHNLKDGYLGSGLRLRRSIRRNGEENFKIEYLEFFDNRGDLFNRERELVNADLLKDPMCMNLKPGGTGGLCDDKHKKKFLDAGLNKVKWLRENDEMWMKAKSKKLSQSILSNPRGVVINGNTNWWYGKKHTEETKQKMCKSKNIGETNSQFGTCWITNGTENKKIKKTDKLPNGWSLGRIIK